MDNIFFDSWESIARTIIITILAYVGMIVMLRFVGKRTLSQMNAYDFVVTIALGSTLATVALNKNVMLADGVVAFFVLISLQFVITWLSVRIKSIRRIVTGTPVLLLYKGELFNDILKRERLTREDIYMAARQKGASDLKDIDIIVLETTGDITIIKEIEGTRAETMEDVENYGK